MRIHITTKNIELTEDIKRYIEEKIGELGKFINYPGEKVKTVEGKSFVEVWVEVGRTTFHHKKGQVFRAEAQLYLPGESLRAESESEDLRTSITEIKDELQRELKKYRGKAEAVGKRKRRFLKKLINLSPLAHFVREAGRAKFGKRKGGRDRLEGN